MAEIISNIASSGGDFTTWSAWEAAIPANPTDDYTGNGLLEETITDSLVINVSNSNNRIIKMTSGIDHQGDFTKGHNFRHIAVDDGNIQVQTTGTIIIEKLRLTKESTLGSSAAVNINSSTPTVHVRQCLIRTISVNEARALRATGAGQTCYFYNNFLWDSGATTNEWNQFGNGTVYFYNNTFLQTSGTRLRCVNRASGTMTCTNNVLLKLGGATQTAPFAGTMTADSNSVWDTNTYGTNCKNANDLAALADASILKDNSAVTPDLHFKSVTDMNNTGTGADLSGTFTTDIDGTTRGVWTRGADYIPSERFVSPGAGQFLTVGGNTFVVA